MQAADLLAYETYQYGIARIENKLKVVSPSSNLHAAISNLRDVNNDSKLFDAWGFHLILKTFRVARSEGKLPG